MSENNDAVGLSVSETRNDKGQVIYRKRIASINLRVPAGAMPLETLRKADNILSDFNKIGDIPPASGPAKPETGSVANVNEDRLITVLDRVRWTQNKNRTGWWARLEEIPLPERAAFLNLFNSTGKKTVMLDGYSYSRFGDANDLVGRFPAKA